MDLPVSDSPVLVLQMHATKLSFYMGAEGHTLAWGDSSVSAVFPASVCIDYWFSDFGGGTKGPLTGHQAMS